MKSDGYNTLGSMLPQFPEGQHTSCWATAARLQKAVVTSSDDNSPLAKRSQSEVASYSSVIRRSDCVKRFVSSSRLKALILAFRWALDVTLSGSFHERGMRDSRRARLAWIKLEKSIVEA